MIIDYGEDYKKSFEAEAVVTDYYIWKTPTEQPLTKGLITINFNRQ